MNDEIMAKRLMVEESQSVPSYKKRNVESYINIFYKLYTKHYYNQSVLRR